jgi:uncharacterized membrane protein
MCLYIRRLKRWIFEKQQRGAQGIRRHRHKSLGDAEANLPKNKRQQQQFAQAIQVGMQLVEIFTQCAKKLRFSKVYFVTSWRMFQVMWN